MLMTFSSPVHLKREAPVYHPLTSYLQFLPFPSTFCNINHTDQEWLEALNTSRRNVGLDNISYEVFEIIIDRLEKEWFDLVSQVQSKESDLC